VSQQTTNHTFDDLARALAEGSISRRRALKLFAGTALAALIPSRALADDDECVRICHVPFNRDTEECEFAKAETRCVSRRERRRHLENHPCDCRGRCANCLTTCPPVACQGGTVTPPPSCECECPDGTMLCFDEACISTECNPGFAFNPETCMCEVTAVCPSEPCCCSCVYSDATGALVSTCHAPFADDPIACITFCRAQTPPTGTTFETQDFSCSLVADEVPVCAPASTGTGMTCGANVPCRPPA
jgi:hypothetical protein